MCKAGVLLRLHLKLHSSHTYIRILRKGKKKYGSMDVENWWIECVYTR